jgi:lipopolysaccharide/colanic/teichoic acid biosynthesis glycosyltransferase
VGDRQLLLVLREGVVDRAWGADHQCYRVVKRVVDGVVSAVLLLACLPLLLLVAAAIVLDSKGPVLFCQYRAGQDGRAFPMYKLRSMRVGEPPLADLAGARNGPVFKIRRDPRITRVGRFLRRTSIDELPQLLNVLLGHMSLIGPRPLPVGDVACWGDLPEGLTSDEVRDWLALRQAVRPGLTGLWQVNGRSLLSLHDWIRYDSRYVRERSLGMDLRIMARTPLAVFLGRGAV